MNIKIKSSLVIFVLFSIATYGQTPQSFKYQAVVRDNSKTIISNQLVNIKASILKNNENGVAIYTETHSITTNQFGTITLDIGKGIIENGNFETIEWGSDNYFLKIEIDLTGGNSYVFMGTSQLLSVPYSFHSNTSEKLQNFSDEQRDTITNIPVGKIFFNTTSKKINYHDGTHWYEINGTCLPQPSLAFAGPDQNNVIGASTILQANTPVVGTGQWIIKSGSGGHINDPSSPTSVFSGLAGTNYTLSWTISNDCGSNSDDVLITISPFTCGVTFKDTRDNKIYKSTLIGSQCWMAENMNIGTRIDGVESMTNNDIIEKYCSGNLDSNCNVYGGLYQWNEMMQYNSTPGTQGICVQGWHVPTDQEWKILEGSVDSQYGVGDPVWDLEGDRGYDGGGKLKEAGWEHWFWPNTGATNSSGFTALPGGARNTNGEFPSLQGSARIWTSTENGTDAFRRVLYFDRMTVTRNAGTINFGHSVRCIKN